MSEKKVGKVVRVTTDNKIEIVEIPWNFEEKRKLINAECLESVRTEEMNIIFSGIDGFDISMFVDESFLIKQLPFNKIASYLYGTQFHGSPICGDVFFYELDPFGYDYPLSHPESVLSMLESVLEILDDFPLF